MSSTWRAGMAVPREAISQKKCTGHPSGPILRVPARSCLNSIGLNAMQLLRELFSCHLGKALARMAGECTAKPLAEFPVPTQSKLPQTLKDQSASRERYRYRLEGNGHPWRKPRRFEAKLRQIVPRGILEAGLAAEALRGSCGSKLTFSTLHL